MIHKFLLLLFIKEDRPLDLFFYLSFSWKTSSTFAMTSEEFVGLNQGVLAKKAQIPAVGAGVQPF